MYKKFWLIGSILVIALLAACGDDSTNETAENEEELAALEVDFELPETANPDETVELKATVTYGEEFVEDAKEVNFEYWLGDDEDNSTTVESTNNGDGTYTTEVTFEEDGVYSIYAHTTARDLHTMPKKKITVGTGKAAEHDSEENEHENNNHAEGFQLHFMEPENVTAAKDTKLMVHLQMDEAPFTNAAVRYEIWLDNSDKHDWVDAKETKAGEYIANYTFSQAGTYHTQIHVKDDDNLHEHKEFEIEVTE